MRKFSAAAAIAAAASIVSLAAPANAATQTLTDCETDVSGQTFEVQAGDVLTVSFANTCTWSYATGQYKGLTNTIGVIDHELRAWDGAGNFVATVQREPMATGQVTLVVTPDPSVSVTTTSSSPNYFYTQTSSVYQGFQVRVLVPVPEASPVDAPALPAPVLQQVPEPATGCESVDRPDLEWSGVGSSGWSASWAQWANDGRGGSICTRTLTYDVGSAAWTVSDR